MRNFVAIKLLTEKAKKPTKANKTDAGFDLYSLDNIVVPNQSRQVIRTGVSLEMPDNLAGLIWPRSGLAVKQGIDVLAGVIDAGYRGEIMVCLYNTSKHDVNIEQGDRIAQIIFQEVPEISMFLSESLNESDRGDGGFGSSGK